MRLRTRSRSLIRSQGCVALNQLHAIQRNAEFFSDQLHLCRVEARSKLALAGVDSHASVGCNGEPRIQRIASGAIEAGRLSGELGDTSCGESDGQEAGHFEKISSL